MAGFSPDRPRDYLRNEIRSIVTMIAIHKPAAAFIQRYREQGGGAQLYNISAVDPTELVQRAGQKNAHGLGIRHSPTHRVGSRYVESPVIGIHGRQMK
ncbi:MAG: hypothetical protein WA013_04580 [Acidovorax sp.]